MIQSYLAARRINRDLDRHAPFIIRQLGQLHKTFNGSPRHIIDALEQLQNGKTGLVDGYDISHGDLHAARDSPVVEHFKQAYQHARDDDVTVSQGFRMEANKVSSERLERVLLRFSGNAGAGYSVDSRIDGLAEYAARGAEPRDTTFEKILRLTDLTSSPTQ